MYVEHETALTSNCVSQILERAKIEDAQLWSFLHATTAAGRNCAAEMPHRRLMGEDTMYLCILSNTFQMLGGHTGKTKQNGIVRPKTICSIASTES